MHELAIADALLTETLAVAGAHGSRAVTSVRLVISRDRQVVPELLAFAFEVLSQGTLAEGASLEWREGSISDDLVLESVTLDDPE